MPNRINFSILKNKTANIGPRTNPGTAKKSFGSGKETLRLRANGPARVEEAVSVISLIYSLAFSSLYLELKTNDVTMPTRRGKRISGRDLSARSVEEKRNTDSNNRPQRVV